jgi:NADPH:quinone reductase-like Zn-dependent oxidoreductase
MNALFLERKAGAEALVFGQLPRPKFGEDEVLVRVHATAITPTECSWFPTFHASDGTPRPFPVVLSHEFSGVVAAVGSRVSEFKIGQAVYGLNDWFQNGAQAEFCVAKATAIATRPAVLNDSEAASVPISALTAWQALFDKARLVAGQSVLIHGGSGAVGSFAVQFARWRGAQVIATASSDRRDLVRSLGANEIIDYRLTRFEDAICGVDVVLDTIGGETLERSWRVLKPGGQMVTIAHTSEDMTDPRVGEAFLLVRADSAQLAKIGCLVDAGTLRVFTGPVFPLEQAQEAYQRASQRGGFGKVVLRVAQ